MRIRYVVCVFLADCTCACFPRDYNWMDFKSPSVAAVAVVAIKFAVSVGDDVDNDGGDIVTKKKSFIYTMNLNIYILQSE